MTEWQSLADFPTNHLEAERARAFAEVFAALKEARAEWDALALRTQGLSGALRGLLAVTNGAQGSIEHDKACAAARKALGIA
jgi:hypothetical protein